MKTFLMIMLVLTVVFSVVMYATGPLSDSILAVKSGGVTFAGVRNVLSLTPGTYTGTGERGHYDTVTVSVTVDSTGILDIVVTEQRETEIFWGMVYPTLAEFIRDANSTGVDVITSASESSHALITAVEDAMLKAGADLGALRTPVASAAAAPAASAAPELPPLPPWPTSFRPGTYEGWGLGYYDFIVVDVTFSATGITAVTVTEHEETDIFANMAFSAMIPAMVAAGNADVDVVTGATGSSLGLIEAVYDAAMEASN